jgi:hypothetical protein
MAVPLIAAGVAARAIAKKATKEIAKKASQRAVVTVRKTKSGITKTGSISKNKPKIESTSYRGKELSKLERKKISDQNKAAESLKSKDLDKVEAAKKAAKTRKLRQQEREEYSYMLGNKRGNKTGAVKGATATAILGGAIYSADKEKKKRQGK